MDAIENKSSKSEQATGSSVKPEAAEDQDNGNAQEVSNLKAAADANNASVNPNAKGEKAGDEKKQQTLKKSPKRKRGGPVNSNLEHKRKISRLSSQRLRQREKERFSNLRTKQTELSKINQTLKLDSEQVRLQIDQVKQIIKLKLELAGTSASCAATAAAVTANASKTLAAAAATLAVNPAATLVVTPAPTITPAVNSSALKLDAASRSTPGTSNIPPSVLMALAQVKSAVPHCKAASRSTPTPPPSTAAALPQALASAHDATGADPPGPHIVSLEPDTYNSELLFPLQFGNANTNASTHMHQNDILELLQQQQRSHTTGVPTANANTMMAQNLIHRSVATGAAVAPVNKGTAPAGALAPPTPSARGGDDVNDLIAQLLQGRAATTTQPAGMNDQLVQLLHARSQQHQQAAAAVEQLKAMLVIQGLSLTPQPAPTVTATNATIHSLLGGASAAAGGNSTAAAPPPPTTGNIQDLLRLLQPQQQQQQQQPQNQQRLQRQQP